LQPASWAQACHRLERSRANLNRHLGGDQRAFIPVLAQLCRELADAGRRLQADPASPENLKAAANLYRQAGRTGSQLPPPADANSRRITAAALAKIAKHQAQADRQLAMAAAAQQWGVIINKTRAAEWQQALERLEAQQDLLAANLSEDHRRQLPNLERFLEAVLAAERTTATVPITQASGQEALALIQAALDAAVGLDDIGIDGPALLRPQTAAIHDVLEKIAQQALSAEQKRVRQELDTITSDLAAGRWRAAMNRFEAHLPDFEQVLPPEMSGRLTMLAAFLRDLSSADTLAGKRSATEADLEKALAHYRNAMLAGENLTEVDAAAIVDGPMKAAEERLKGLRQSRLAGRILERARADLTPARWRQAHTTLTTYEKVLEDYLPAAERTDVAGLLAFLNPLALAEDAIAAGEINTARQRLQEARELMPPPTERFDPATILAAAGAALPPVAGRCRQR
jgi:hypothetical protein